MSAPSHAAVAAVADRRRMFVALWPDDAVRSEMQAAFAPVAAAAGGRPVPDSNLHLTLEFLGSVDEQRREDLVTAIAAVPVPAFSVELDRIEYWPMMSALVATPRTPPAELVTLQAALRAALAARDFRVDVRPFRPHVTLAHAVAGRPATNGVAQVGWHVNAIALVESFKFADGSRYRPLARWVKSNF